MFFSAYAAASNTKIRPKLTLTTGQVKFNNFKTHSRIFNELCFYQYVPEAQRMHTLTGVNIGMEIPLKLPYVRSLELGLGYYNFNKHLVEGRLIQGIDRLSASSYDYHYRVKSQQLMLESKLFLQIHHSILPYAIAGLGNACGRTFTLLPQQSCVLELDITGLVDSFAPNPRDHLFVCLPGCPSCCNGTFYPLNISREIPPFSMLVSLTVTPKTGTLTVGERQQFTATAAYSDGSIIDVTSLANWSSSNASVAIIDANSGLATATGAGMFQASATFGDLRASSQNFVVTQVPAILVSLRIEPTQGFMTLGDSQPFQAIATYSNGTTLDVTSASVWSSSNENVATMNINTGVATAINTGQFVATAVFGNQTASSNIFTVRAQIAYITNFGDNSISQCQIASNGILQNCTKSFGYSQPEGVVLTANAKTAYISQNSASQPIRLCSVNNITGMIQNCTNSGYLSPPSSPQGITINKANTVLYASNFTNVIRSCAINPGNGTLNCTSVNVNGRTTGVALNDTNEYAYFSDFENNVVLRCLINQNSGGLQNCINSNASNVSSSDGIGINNNYLYIGSSTGNRITKCNIIAETGLVENCVDSGAGAVFSRPQNIAFTFNKNFAYVPNRSNNTISYCAVSSVDGSLSNCVLALGANSGLSEPTAMLFK